MLLDAVTRHADETPDAVALRAGGRAVSYGEIGRSLARARAGEAAVVVVRAGEPIETMMALLVARAAGGVPVAVEGELEVGDVELFAGSAWLKRTGGSTGTPKLCAFSEAQALANARQNARIGGLARSVTSVATVPPWTSFGWNAWMGALVSGATLHYVPPTAPREWLTALSRVDVASGVTTPPVVRAAARLPSHGLVRRAWVSCSAAAYPLAEALEVERRHGLVVHDRLGATETGTIAIGTAPGSPLVGAPDVDVSIVGGTLTVSGPTVALGICGGPAFDGTFRTNDIVAEVEGGFVVRGRSDRIVKRMGRIVDLAELEALIVRREGVRHARVIAEARGLDVDLVAFVVGEVEGLAAWLAERVAAHERPTRIERVEASGELAKWTSAHG